jgi:hypothetical protein
MNIDKVDSKEIFKAQQSVRKKPIFNKAILTALGIRYRNESVVRRNLRFYVHMRKIENLINEVEFRIVFKKMS